MNLILIGIILIVCILLVIFMYFINVKKEQFYSDLKVINCRSKNKFDFFEKLRDYIYEIRDSSSCDDKIPPDVQRKAFRDEANFNTNSNFKHECNKLAEKQCTFNYDIPSLNVNCYNDYFSWCVDAHYI